MAQVVRRTQRLKFSEVDTMRDIHYLTEFASEWKRIGEADFRTLFGRPALIGLGVVGQLQDKDDSARMTWECIDLSEAPHRPASLVNRVWLIRKKDKLTGGLSITVGRGADNDLVIPEYSVSNRHGKFEFRGAEEVIFTDLRSLNGTYVNGQHLKPQQPRPLRDGDHIVLGRFQFRFFSRPGFVRTVANFS